MVPHSTETGKIMATIYIALSKGRELEGEYSCPKLAQEHADTLYMGTVVTEDATAKQVEELRQEELEHAENHYDDYEVDLDDYDCDVCEECHE